MSFVQISANSTTSTFKRLKSKTQNDNPSIAAALVWNMRRLLCNINTTFRVILKRKFWLLIAKIFSSKSLKMLFIIHNNRRFKFQTSAAVIEALLSFWILDFRLLKVEVVRYIAKFSLQNHSKCCVYNNRRFKFQTSAAVIETLLSFWILDFSPLKVEVVRYMAF